MIEKNLPIYIYIYIYIGLKRGNFYQKTEEISGWKTHTSTLKLNWNISTITDVLLYQKKINVCKHMGAFFTVYSHTFTLFWLRKTLVIVEKLQLNFCIYMRLIQRSLHFSVRVSYFFFLFLCIWISASSIVLKPEFSNLIYIHIVILDIDIVPLTWVFITYMLILHYVIRDLFLLLLFILSCWTCF